MRARLAPEADGFRGLAELALQQSEAANRVRHIEGRSFGVRPVNLQRLGVAGFCPSQLTGILQNVADMSNSMRPISMRERASACRSLLWRAALASSINLRLTKSFRRSGRAGSSGLGDVSGLLNIMPKRYHRDEESITLSGDFQAEAAL